MLKIKNVLKRFDPKIFPTPNSALPFRSATMVVISSGSDVPTAVINKPSIDSLIPLLDENSTMYSTRYFPEITNNTREDRKKRRLKGMMLLIFWGLFSQLTKTNRKTNKIINTKPIDEVKMFEFRKTVNTNAKVAIKTIGILKCTSLFDNLKDMNSGIIPSISVTFTILLPIIFAIAKCVCPAIVEYVLDTNSGSDVPIERITNPIMKELNFSFFDSATA